MSRLCVRQRPAPTRPVTSANLKQKKGPNDGFVVWALGSFLSYFFDYFFIKFEDDDAEVCHASKPRKKAQVFDLIPP